VAKCWEENEWNKKTNVCSKKCLANVSKQGMILVIKVQKEAWLNSKFVAGAS
jgi:hypothetical protein